MTQPLLPTSIVGSLPKPSWLAQPETLWSPWSLQGDALVEGKRDALRISTHEQSNRGIDIVSDGEQTRQHFVTTFIEHLSGVDFEKRKTYLAQPKGWSVFCTPSTSGKSASRWKAAKRPFRRSMLSSTGAPNWA